MKYLWEEFRQQTSLSSFHIPWLLNTGLVNICWNRTCECFIFCKMQANSNYSAILYSNLCQGKGTCQLAQHKASANKSLAQWTIGLFCLPFFFKCLSRNVLRDPSALWHKLKHWLSSIRDGNTKYWHVCLKQSSKTKDYERFDSSLYGGAALFCMWQQNSDPCAGIYSFVHPPCFRWW